MSWRPSGLEVAFVCMLSSIALLIGVWILGLTFRMLA